MFKTSRLLILLFGWGAFSMAVMSGASAAEWGSIKGRFLVAGAPPKPMPLTGSRDQFCTDNKPMDETVAVGEEGALANVLVFIRVGRRETIEAHPDYAAQMNEPVVLDNKGCKFIPHVALVRENQILTIKNSDPTGHNSNLALFRFNPSIAAGEEVQTKVSQEWVSRARSIPVQVTCNIHPFMQAYVLALDHPYMAVSAEDGTFEIKNIPVGKREFQFWHEAPGYLKDVKFAGGVLNRQGRAELTIANGQILDLGDITVPAAILE